MMKNIYKNLFSAALAFSLALNLVPCGLAFADELPPGGVGGVSEVIDYSQNVDTSGYKFGFNGWSTQGSASSVVVDGVLNWTTSDYGANNTYAVMTIPLEKEIDPAKGEFSVSVTAKLPNKSGRRIRGFAILGANTNATYDVNTDTLMGPAQVDDSNGYTMETGFYDLWMYKQDDASNFSSNSDNNNVGTKSISDIYFISQANANADYVTYKFDIDPQDKTFRFYFKKEGDAEWTEPYSDFYMMNSNTAEANDRFSEPGILPIKHFPNKIKSLKFRYSEYNANTKAEAATTYIKNITVEQIEKPSVTEIKQGETVISENAEDVATDMQTDIVFNMVVKPETVSKDNIYLVNAESGERVDDSIYSLVQSDDFKTVSIKFAEGKALEFGKKYRLEISGIKAYTEIEGEMKNEKVISFSTAEKYKALDLKVEDLGERLKFGFNLKDYVKENNGNKYVVIASLVEKQTNTTYDIKAVCGKSVFEDKAVKTTSFSFYLEKTADFSADNFEIRLYVWNGFENSQSVLKTSTSATASN